MEGWKDGRMEGWKDGRMEGWKDGRMEGWKDGRMEGWKDGRMEEGMLRFLSECTSHLGEYAANRGLHRGRGKRGV